MKLGDNIIGRSPQKPDVGFIELLKWIQMHAVMKEHALYTEHFLFVERFFYSEDFFYQYVEFIRCTSCVLHPDHLL